MKELDKLAIKKPRLKKVIEAMKDDLKDNPLGMEYDAPVYLLILKLLLESNFGEKSAQVDNRIWLPKNSQGVREENILSFLDELHTKGRVEIDASPSFGSWYLYLRFYQGQPSPTPKLRTQLHDYKKCALKTLTSSVAVLTRSVRRNLLRYDQLVVLYEGQAQTREWQADRCSCLGENPPLYEGRIKKIEETSVSEKGNMVVVTVGLAFEYWRTWRTEEFKFPRA